MPATQKSRMLAIGTVLGEDALLIKTFSLTEHLGRLFQIEAELRSDNREIKFEDIVGTDATVRLELPDGKGTRYFNGCVSRFVQIEHRGSYAVYEATLVPWVWFLTRTADCRIFQKKKVPDIIEDVFKGHGFSDYKLKLTGTYREWEYCVQYRETDFNFISRLMEQEGIYYYFEHTDGAHTLVLADSPSAHEAYEGYGTMTYRPPATEREEHAETITEWVIEKEIQPGQYALNDFNFTTPKTSLLANANISRQHQAADYEIYDYPGEYEQRTEGEGYAKMRIQELQIQFETLRAHATVRGVSTGCKFTLQGNPREDQNRDYLITSASYHIKAGEYETGRREEEEFYECDFIAVPIDQKCPYRPERLTPKPFIQGPQTAIVVGPKGDEIHTEDNARVKVQFHWDRYGKFDENSSCWIRVSQPWAGKSWGSMATPRIGQEVIVEFLEGDPDRPIITGRVYNADQPPPYASGKGVVSGLKSQTHKGSGYNEMSMDDTAGKEKITIHAQYDMGTTVEHDDTQTVHNDRTITVDGKHTETIKKDTTIKITEGKLDHDVVAGTAKYHVKGAVAETFDDKQETTVNKDIVISSQTTKIHVTAATEIQLQVGASKLLMKSDGSIELSGNNVAIKGSQTVQIKGASITSQADADNNTKGAIVLSEGSASNTVKGGVVMLNP